MFILEIQAEHGGLSKSGKTIIKISITDKSKEYQSGTSYEAPTVPGTVPGTSDTRANNCLGNILEKSCISKFNKILITC